MNIQLLFYIFIFIIKGRFVIQGRICKIESKDYYVLDDSLHSPVRCVLRGKFKKDFQLKKDKLFSYDVAAVGDVVEYDLNSDGTGFIHTVRDRENFLSRKALKIKGSGRRGERLEQVVAANIHNLVIVTSTMQPRFNNKLLDRIIVAGESAHLEVIIVINKTDLADEDEIAYWAELYGSIGYQVFPFSVKNAQGSKVEIYDHIKGKRNVFWGQSGVGKSSLLNFLYPEVNFKVGDVSTYSMKGKHTTVTSRLVKVSEDTIIIDTPGIREIDPYGISKENLSHYFLEFAPFMRECRFNTCTHYHEPGCGVVKAVEEEKISIERYESYLNLLNTIEDDLFF